MFLSLRKIGNRKKDKIPRDGNTFKLVNLIALAGGILFFLFHDYLLAVFVLGILLIHWPRALKNTGQQIPKLSQQKTGRQQFLEEEKSKRLKIDFAKALAQPNIFIKIKLALLSRRPESHLLRQLKNQKDWPAEEKAPVSPETAVTAPTDKKIHPAKEEPSLTRAAAKNRLIAPWPVKKAAGFWPKALNFLKHNLFSWRLSGRIIALFILTVALGTLIFAPLCQNEDKNLKQSDLKQIEASFEEGRVLGEKTLSETKALSTSENEKTFKQTTGRGLAAVALIFGLLFLFYSLKYYLTVILVLLASQSLNQNGRANKNSGLLYRLFFKSREGNGNGAAGLQSNFNEDKPLNSYPFVSIQLPFYNEKKVANRILIACTSFDYPNYEVIVVDDSNDETMATLKHWAKHPRVKIIHREKRSGFKGGALREAMKIQDKRTRFVIIFDADFIPYPDTIRQFLKYFQINGSENGNKETNLAAVQGYQWHILNKNENWITRSVRAEFAGSYVIERSGNELINSLKQIAGSVYMIRADVLSAYNWTDSITEDFELTMRIYRDGWKVIYTPYIQAPAECVSTLNRLIRQRMRWAEGHTSNIRRYFWSMLKSPRLSRREKMEFLYLAPYYLQSFFLLIGTAAWFISDIILHTHLPFWTALWGWSLVFTNMLSLPLVNSVGLFFEESEKRDYLGILSFIALCYILAPFQALAALRGLFNKEGGWFRTPKSGHITDLYFRSKYRRWLRTLFPDRQKEKIKSKKPDIQYSELTTSHSTFQNFKIRRKRGAGIITKAVCLLALISTLVLNIVSFSVLDHRQLTTLRMSGGVIAEQEAEEEKETALETRQAKTPEITARSIASFKDMASENGIFEENIREGNWEVRADLPEKVKESVKEIFNDFPEDKDEVELVDLRTEKSKQYLREDGKISQTLGLNPIHYKDELGNWQDINLQIQNVNKEILSIQGFESSFEYENTANTFKSYFKESAEGNNYLTLVYQGKEINLTLPENTGLGPINKNKARVSNNTVTYPDIYPGIDLRYTLSETILLEEYIIKSPEALENLESIGQIFESSNTSFTQNADGSIQFKDKSTSQNLWQFPKPVLYELNNQNERNYGLTREITEKEGKYLSKKILNEEGIKWLRDSARKYPLVIDDTIMVNLDDTNYLDGHIVYDGTNYTKSESGNSLLIGGDTTPDPDESYRAYIRFDITDLSDSITYQEADFFRVLDKAYATDTVDIKALPNDPDDQTAQQLWEDIEGATVYVDDSTYFQNTSSYGYLYNLGTTALSNLNSALTDNWFGVSFQGSNETDDYAGIIAEEAAGEKTQAQLRVIYEAVAGNQSITTNPAIYARRNNFYDAENGKYWVILSDGTTAMGYYSTDGESWTADSANTFTGRSPNIWWEPSTGKLYTTYYVDPDTRFRIGTVSSTSISWGSEYNVFDGTNWYTDGYQRGFVTRDTEGYCWISATYWGSSGKDIYTASSSNTDCTSWNSPEQVSTTTYNCTGYGCQSEILPLADGDVYVLWNNASNVMGRQWDESASAWLDEDTIDTTRSSSYYYTPSGVVDSNYDIHIVYTDSSSTIHYGLYDSGTLTWDTDCEIVTAGYAPHAVSLDTNTNTLYWFNGSSDALTWKRFLNYRTCDLDDDCTNPSNWSAQVKFWESYYAFDPISSNYKENGVIFVSFAEGRGAVDSEIVLEIPENIWFLIPLLILLPKLAKKKYKLKNKNR